MRNERDSLEWSTFRRCMDLMAAACGVPEPTAGQLDAYWMVLRIADVNRMEGGFRHAAEEHKIPGRMPTAGTILAHIRAVPAPQRHDRRPVDAPDGSWWDENKGRWCHPPSATRMVERRLPDGRVVQLSEVDDMKADIAELRRKARAVGSTFLFSFGSDVR